MNKESGTQKAIYKKWWFWVVVFFVALILALPLWFAFQFVSFYAKKFLVNAYNGLGAQIVQYQSDRLEKAYKEDTYGGDTPEETLRLYVQALEMQDYALASKYYIPEDQEEHEKFLKSIKGNGLDKYISAYGVGDIKGTLFEGGNIYEFEISSGDEDYPYLERLILNQLTNKWKLTELE